jgi:hypothetical protein
MLEAKANSRFVANVIQLHPDWERDVYPSLAAAPLQATTAPDCFAAHGPKSSHSFNTEK